MRNRLLALSALLVLAACGQGGIQGFAARPPANPPSVQTAPKGTVPQANIPEAQRPQLESLVRDLLDKEQQQFGEGFRPGAGFNDEVAALQPGTDHRTQVNLVSGTSYRIIGSCDAECHNIDIELLDSTGSVVASDMLDDDVPVVNYTPTASGHFTVRLLMQNCTLAPCYSGTRILTAAPAPAEKPI